MRPSSVVVRGAAPALVVVFGATAWACASAEDGDVGADMPPTMLGDGSVDAPATTAPARSDAATSKPDAAVTPGPAPPPDAATATPETGAPQLPDAGTRPLLDAGRPETSTGPVTPGGDCPANDPSYSVKAVLELASPTFTDCVTGCSAAQCCFSGIVCVPL